MQGAIYAPLMPLLPFDNNIFAEHAGFAMIQSLLFLLLKKGKWVVR